MGFMFRVGSRVCCVTVKNLGSSRRGIYGRVMRETLKVPPRPPPYDYKNKPFTLFRSWFDMYSSDRFDDNTKVIVVDGPIAAGKTEFAKQLAADLDMKHFEEANMDISYINYYGQDVRDLNPKLPENIRFTDHTDFCKNPNHINAAAYQIANYMCRYSQYFDAIAHMLNSGQGVVLERSPFSDFVFADAMRESGYISKAARSVYQDIYNNSIIELLRPHLVIYLDVPVNVVKERVKQRNLPYEKDSKIFNDKYLGDLEKSYKEKYLKQAGIHSLLLVYDWSDRGDVEVVVEDIERLDFDCYGRWDDEKLKDYNMEREYEWMELRQDYSSNNYKMRLMYEMNLPRTDAPELMSTGEEYYEYWKVLEETPGYKFAEGYNPDMGDNVLLKNKFVSPHATKQK